MTQGTIVSLRARQGFGFITAESRRHNVLFFRDAVEGTRFDQLREGQAVEFAERPYPPDPKRMFAERVRPRVA